MYEFRNAEVGTATEAFLQMPKEVKKKVEKPVPKKELKKPLPQFDDSIAGLEHYGGDFLSVLDLPIQKQQQVSLETEFDSEKSLPLSELVSKIALLWKIRQRWHAAEKALTLRIKSTCRYLCPLPPTDSEKNEEDGDDDEFGSPKQKTFRKNVEADNLYKALMGKGVHSKYAQALFQVEPFMLAMAPLEQRRLEIEKLYGKLARQLPGYDFCLATVGISPNLLVSIVGEAPGLNSRSLLDFATPFRLWKRLGMSVMPDGTRQRAITGEQAKIHGYVRERRSIIWTYGQTILRGKNRENPGPYYDHYVKTRTETMKRWNARNIVVIPSMKIASIAKATSLEKKQEIANKALFKCHETDAIYPEQYTINEETTFRNQAHFNAHCKRMMEKQLIWDLWHAFRKDCGFEKWGEVPIDQEIQIRGNATKV